MTMNRPEIISVFSQAPAAGVSKLVAGLAAQFARHGGKKVLVIDWNFARPAQNKLLNSGMRHWSAGVHGLFEKISRACREQDRKGISQTVEELNLQELIVATNIKGIHMMPSRSFVDHSTEESPFDFEQIFNAYPELFQHLAQRLTSLDYDCVLIDCPSGKSQANTVCAFLMPTVLLSLYTHSEVLSAASTVPTIETAAAAVAYRKGSDDLRSLCAIPCRSRMPQGLTVDSAAERNSLARLLDHYGMELRFLPAAAGISISEQPRGGSFAEIEVLRLAALLEAPDCLLELFAKSRTETMTEG